METKASAKYVRISPRKARLVVDLIRGKDVGEAQQILDYSDKAAARVIGKVLNAAIANAEHNNNLDADDLFVSRAFVDEGPTLKRFRPRALGRATRINKRTSHITLVLDEREPRPEAKRRRFRRRPKPKPQAPGETPVEITEEELEEIEEPEEGLAEAAAEAAGEIEEPEEGGATEREAAESGELGEAAEEEPQAEGAEEQAAEEPESED